MGSQDESRAKPVRTFIACFGPGTTLGCQDRSRAKPVEEIPHQFWSRVHFWCPWGPQKSLWDPQKSLWGPLAGPGQNQRGKSLPVLVQGTTLGPQDRSRAKPVLIQGTTLESLGGSSAKPVRQILTGFGPGGHFGVPWRVQGKKRRGKSSPALVQGTTLGSLGEVQVKTGKEIPRRFWSMGPLWDPRASPGQN